MALRELLVVAGEASGDQHAADVVAALRSSDPDLRFFGMGGAKMKAAGVDLVYGAHEVSVMGITEVLPKLRRILQVMRGLERAASRRRPACAVLVDIPDFNLRLAARLKRMGIPVVYYVSPMVWAWRPGRVKTISRVVDRMLCILPFEEDFYRGTGVHAKYVGSPVLEQVPAPGPAEAFRARLALPEGRPTVALLPGSRRSEVQRILPTLVSAAKTLSAERPELQLVVPVAPGMPQALLADAFQREGLSPIFVAGRAPEAVAASDVAVVASGTATLEAGLMGRPLVVVYRVSLLTYLIGRLFLRVAHVALVNLLLRRRAVPELLQGEMTSARIAEEVRQLLPGGTARDRMVEDLRQLRALLGAPGAARRAADEVLSVLEQRTASGMGETA